MKIHRGNFESNKYFLEKINLLKKSSKILELGSGTGFFTNYLKTLGYDVTGTEINDEYIKFAKKEFGIELKKMQGDSLDLPSEYFDFVISFDVFEHIPDTNKHLNEVNRVLKPGGSYLFGTPNKITNIPFEILKEKSFTKWREYHCSLHTYLGMKKVLTKNGFEFKFISVPVVNEAFLNKLRKYTGFIGIFLVKIFNPDKFPMWLKTNFYLIAKKIQQK